MKKINTTYWVITSFMCALILFSSIPDILKEPSAVAFITDHLGYPEYFVIYIGVAKVLGVIAILVPGFNRLKEWAYAGIIFDLVSAIFSGLAVGDPLIGWLPVLIGIALVFTSYYFHHKRLKALAALAHP